MKELNLFEFIVLFLLKPIYRTFEYYSCLQSRAYFYKNALIHPSVKILLHATVTNLSHKSQLIKINKNSTVRGELVVFADGGEISIGSDCYIGDRTRLWSAATINIGNRVYISHNVNIHDTNSHSINPEIRYQHYLAIISNGFPQNKDFDIQSKPIFIEDDVWIGFNSTILKGVKIGRGSVVGANSVVTKDVPAWTIVAGNPARVIREITENERSTLNVKQGV